MNLRGKYLRFKSKYVVKQRRPYEYAINRYYAHIIDPFFTKLVYDLKLTPNAVTVITGVIGVCAGLSFLFQQWVLGAILLQFHHMMDGADGNLARLTNRCTEFGAKLDQLSDQIVRFVLFVCLAISVDVEIWAKWLLPITILFDVWVVQRFILPFSRRYDLRRARWKQWFLDKGIIPGFDIFTIYFIISISGLFGIMEISVYLIIVMKNLDWIYRVYECVKTSYFSRRGEEND